MTEFEGRGLAWGLPAKVADWVHHVGTYPFFHSRKSESAGRTVFCPVHGIGCSPGPSGTWCRLSPPARACRASERRGCCMIAYFPPAPDFTPHPLQRVSPLIFWLCVCRTHLSDPSHLSDSGRWSDSKHLADPSHSSKSKSFVGSKSCVGSASLV